MHGRFPCGAGFMAKAKTMKRLKRAQCKTVAPIMSVRGHSLAPLPAIPKLCFFCCREASKKTSMHCNTPSFPFRIECCADPLRPPGIADMNS